MKTVSFMSGKGGVGKSTITAAVAKSLAKKDIKTLVLELDIPLRSLDHLFSVVDRVVFDIGDISNGREIDEVILNVSKNLDYIPSPVNVDAVINKELLQSILNGVSDKYDFCLIDCRASIDSLICDISSLSDMAVIVVTPDEISLRDGAILSDYLHYNDILDAANHRIIINKVDMKRKNVIGNFDNIIDTIGAQLLGVVPSFQTSNEQQQIYRNMADRLLGKNLPLLVK